MKSWWDSPADGLVVCSRSALVEIGAVLPPPGRIVVAHLDGARMPDAAHTFYEFSDALLFPDYFGWNWDALSDCLEDLKWLPADGYLILVEDVPQLLSDNIEDRHTLFQILSRAARHWASPLGKAPVTFKVLLMCDDEEQVDLVSQELAGPGDYPS